MRVRGVSGMNVRVGGRGVSVTSEDEDDGGGEGSGTDIELKQDPYIEIWGKNKIYIVSN